jgi:predicted enzyme related to lactoylglutathione lyase
VPITHVGFISIPTRDLDAAIDFYTMKLGFQKTTDAPMGPGARWVELTPPGQAGGHPQTPGAQTRVVLLAKGNPAFDEDRIGKGIAAPFEVKDFEATCAELKERGVRFKAEPDKKFYGWWAEILDGDGNVLGLHGDA